MKHALALLSPVVLALLGACAATEPKSAKPELGSNEASSNLPLEGTEWRLVEVGGKPAIPGVGSRTASIVFGPDTGSVRGNSGLNSFFGPYAVDGAKLRIENLAMTRVAGAPELMAQEGAFLAALSVARTWRAKGDALELLDEKGAILATLRATSAG
jgi:heat shock protein HslJ